MRKCLLALTASMMLASPALAAYSYLVRSWYQNGSQMCEYSNGTVLNVGARTCPSSI